MTLLAHTIQSAAGSKKTSKRLGRGNASQKGSKSARGGKGQTARSGGTRHIARRALKPMLQKVPKLRGFRSLYAKPETVTIAALEKIVKDGETVTPIYLKQHGLIRGLGTGVKIIGIGPFTKKCTLEGVVASKGVISMVEKAGGKIVF